MSLYALFTGQTAWAGRAAAWMFAFSTAEAARK